MRKRLGIWLCLLLTLATSSRAQINTDHMMMVGRNALYFNDYVLSIQYFNQVINAKPYLYQPYFFRGLAKFYLDDYTGADLDCTAAIERNPFVVDCYQVRGLARIHLERYDEAIADYRQALEYDPENPGLWHNLALCYGQKKDYEAAIGVLDTLHRTVPSYNAALTMRAQAHMQQNDTVAALADIAESLSRNKYDPDVYAMRAIVSLQQERYADAEEDLTTAIRLQPVSSYYINRALARWHQQKLRDAMSDYDIAIDMEPNSFLGHFNRGLMRAQVGDDNRAIEDFDVVIEQEPDNSIALLNRGMLRTKVGEWEGAEEDFTAILEDYPKFIMGYEYRAEIRRKLGKRKLAEEDELKVLRAQLKNFGGGTTTNEDVDENDNEDSDDNEGGGTRRKSDRDLKKYKRMVVADEDVSLDGNSYATDYRGRVQNRNIYVELLPLYVLTYYEKESQVARAIHNHHDLDQLNRSGDLPLPLLLTCSEQALDEDRIEFHFADINERSSDIANRSSLADDGPLSPIASTHLADAWFARGLDFYLSQDLISAIADFSGAIATDGSMWPAYLNRAVARFKQVLIEESEQQQSLDNVTSLSNTTNRNAVQESSFNTQIGSMQLIIADLSKVIDLAPDFPYAYYNRGNVNARMRDYHAAINDYNEAIRLDANFAEAYYNRGLTQIYLGRHEAGIADLSKAGELGLYTAYNLIKRFRQ